MNFCGIDPDKSGAIVLISPDYEILQIVDMPIRDTGRQGKTTKVDYDGERINQTLIEMQSFGSMYVVLEEPIYFSPGRSKPGTDGVVSVENSGGHRGNQHVIWKGFGIVKGILIARQIPYVERLPSQWKKKMGFPVGSDKAYSITVAKQLFPQTTAERTFIKPKGRKESLHGRADALLLAAYGLQQHGGQLAAS
jgi:hypothetical protein